MTHNNNQLAPDVLSRLKQATGFLHAQLDQQLPLANPLAKECDYLQHIHLFYQWLVAIQETLIHQAHLPQDYLDQNQQSLTWLAEDMQVAGMALPHSYLSFSLTPDHAAAWGVQYVIEGSYLGASELFKRFAELRSIRCPMKFFRERSQGSALRCKQFRQDIATVVNSEQDIVSAEQAARQAFEHFLLLMSDAPQDQYESSQRYA
ncbi:hypothetical protein LG202_11940 [Methylobacillus methanolivorans]